MVENAFSAYGGMASAMMEMLNCMYGSGGAGGHGSDCCHESDCCEEGNSSDCNSSPFETFTYLSTYIPVDFKSNRRCDVCLDLYPHTNIADLNPADLTLTNGDHPPMVLNHVAAFVPVGSSTTPSLLQINLTQQAGAPAGDYGAEVWDTSGKCRGTLTLRLYKP